MKLQIPGSGELEIKTIVLDLNGTLSVGGELVDGVGDQLRALGEKGLELILLTGNTRGDADDIASELGIDWEQARTALDKRDVVRRLGAATCASIGNGRIDKEMMEEVALAVLTLQAEGIHTETFLASDIVVPTVNDALDLFIDTDRLIATLRK